MSLLPITKFGPQSPVGPGNPPKYYECDICGAVHPWAWDGDCRDDANRLDTEDLDRKHGPMGYELATMDERLAEDQGVEA